MLPTTGTRALSSIASKLHTQLPLSSRESQQLLTLLTTSFRTHLDREHPLPNQNNVRASHHISSAGKSTQRGPSPTRNLSSHASATRHIDSILTNPLFAIKPRRRGSDSIAVEVLRDPLTWFLEEIAAGLATLPKMAMCLEVLRGTITAYPEALRQRSAVSVMDGWLRSSGLEISRDFIEACVSKTGRSTTFMNNLVSLMLSEGNSAAPWRYYIRPENQRIKDAGLSSSQVQAFRQQLLLKIVSIQTASDVNAGLSAFMQAFRMAEVEGHEAAFNTLRPAGAYLVDQMVSRARKNTNPELYRTLQLTTPRWLGNWSRVVESMLWLHHPTLPNVSQGLQFIQDPQGAILFTKASKSRRKFLVQFCLGLSRQLIEEERLFEAQTVMEFTQVHFADLVMPKTSRGDHSKVTERRAQQEKQNLEMLDDLVPI